MFALSGLALAALGVLAAVIVYDWPGGPPPSAPPGVRVLVRGGILVLIAVPVAGMLLLVPSCGSSAERATATLIASAGRDGCARPSARRGQTRMRDQGAFRRRCARISARLTGPRLRHRPRLRRRQVRRRRGRRSRCSSAPTGKSSPTPSACSTTAERGRRLELGRAMVTVPKSHQVPNIERPWVVKIPYFDVTIYEEAEDPAKHFTMQEIKKVSEADFLALARERIADVEPLQGSRAGLRARLQHVVRSRDLPHGADRLRPEVRRRRISLQLALGRRCGELHLRPRERAGVRTISARSSSTSSSRRAAPSRSASSPIRWATSRCSTC